MGAQTNYIREQLVSLQSQVDAFQVNLGSLSTAVTAAVANSRFLDNTEREPDRSKTQAAYQALSGLVSAINAVTVNIPSEADFMADFDAAVAADAE